ncbi:MAG: SRPBCC domain-containing protein [Bacteroidia bacterium]|nr:SRPBCC domain-containing protein [Bacteroidia bacterium]
METLQFSVLIEASPEVVYKTIIDPSHFQKWTSIFSPTSYFEGNWAEGSKMRFLAKDEEGNLSGMLSRIKKNTPNQFISIEHYGWIQNDKEVTAGKDVEAIKGALENYTITKEDNLTKVTIDSDAFPEMEDFFLETWPKALEILKEICETQ